MRSHQELVGENIALVGAPNSGKTTLYNWLTNSKFKTVNYPGATIEYSIGNLADRYKQSENEISFSVMDTPGTYSLFPKSADEEVTIKALYEHPSLGPASKVILVVDGTQLARHLLIAEQFKETGFPFVIALTMSDLLRKNKIELETKILEQEFGTKVIPVDGILGGGIQELIQAVRNLPGTVLPKKLSPWTEAIFAEKLMRAEWLAKEAGRTAFDKGLKLSAVYDSTANADRILLHPIWGLAIFFLIMWVLFSSIYWGAQPLMELVDLGFSSLKDIALSISPGSLVSDFIGNGVVASFGAVFVFVPQIFILFLGIGVLESSGYLARAATLIDQPFSKIGLSGRSFVPILSGFACAVPAVMATRNISSPRDRWITNFVIPLMTCSARLPVYALLLAFIFKDQPAWKAGFVLAGLYMASLVIGAIAAAILNKILARNDKSLFMMELPIYRKPQFKVLFRQTLTRTMGYISRAGPVIFIFAVLIWVGTTLPNYHAQDAVKLQTSYLAQAGHGVEPIFRPMGVDWRVGVGLISAFAAREVFVSSLAVMFNISDNEEQQSDGLLSAMQEARDSTGALIFTPATVAGLIIFFMIALQCMSTFAIQVKENGSLSFAIFQLVLFNLVAYGLAVGAVQGLRALGIS